MMAAAEENSNELSEKDPAKASDLSNAIITESASADDNCPPSNISSPSKHVDESAVITTEAVSKKGEESCSSPQNTRSLNTDTDIPATDLTTGMRGLYRCEGSLFDESSPELLETNVVQNSPGSESDSKVSLDFDDEREDLLADLNPVETGVGNTVEDSISRKNRVSNQNEVLAGENVSEDKDTADPPKFSPKLLKAVINCVPQALPDHVVKHFKGDETSDSRKRKLSKNSDSSKQVKLSDSSRQMKLRDSSKQIKPSDSSKLVKLSDSNKQMKLRDSSKHMKLSDSSKQMKLSDSSKQVKLSDSSKEVKLSDSSKQVKLSDSSKQVKLSDSSKEVKLSDSSKQVKLSDSSKEVKLSDSSKQVKLRDSSKPEKTNAENAVLVTAEVPLTAAKNCMVDRSTELDKSDKFYDIKRILLQATRVSSGVNLQRFRQYSNIFLKNWRFSKQFSRSTNSRGKQIIYNTLEKIVKDLYENRLIKVKGPEENVDVVKMLTEEVKQDNSRMFSQTPPTLTVLITTELFDKYFTGSVKESLPVTEVTAPKRGAGIKSVNLGSASNQWIRLKDELGMETNEEVASILIHCYKAWISVACSKCRRHMEVGMEQKSGRSISNSETSVCIVSCDCGKSTSGGFMIECDVCHKWQHGFCVNVDKDNIPESYSCSWCRKIRGKVVLSPAHKKGEDSDDSVVSIDNTKLCSTDDSEPEVIELD